MANQRLTFDKPLWHVEVINNASGDSSTVFSVNHAIGDGLRLVRASGVFTRYEDGSEAKLELLARISKAKQQQRPGIISSLGRAVMDFGAVLAADKQPRLTQRGLPTTAP